MVMLKQSSTAQPPSCSMCSSCSMGERFTSCQLSQLLLSSQLADLVGLDGVEEVARLNESRIWRPGSDGGGRRDREEVEPHDFFEFHCEVVSKNAVGCTSARDRV